MKQGLSKKSQKFLENLRLYLLSNGKEEKDIVWAVVRTLYMKHPMDEH
jgi:hypothetical protein